MELLRAPFLADERTMLNAYLDVARDTIVRKVSGVTDEQARWSPVPTGTSLLGLVCHLTEVERWWFAYHVGDMDVTFAWSDEDPDADFRGPEGATLAGMVAAYEQECERSRAVVAAASLDQIIGGERPGRSVRWVLLHMIEETARHAGHADIVRELVDGAVGD